eukprot:314794-Amphidinium_carterae.1
MEILPRRCCRIPRSPAFFQDLVERTVLMWELYIAQQQQRKNSDSDGEADDKDDDAETATATGSPNNTAEVSSATATFGYTILGDDGSTLRLGSHLSFWCFSFRGFVE